MKEEIGQCPQPEKVVEFEKFNRTAIAEMRPVSKTDLENFKASKCIIVGFREDPLTVSISDVDINNGSPKIGDMIARNPENHVDQWLVGEKYFNDNFDKSKKHLYNLESEEFRLKEGIEKLYDFTQSDKMDKINDFQKTIIAIQLDAMRTYWRCTVAIINNALQR